MVLECYLCGTDKELICIKSGIPIGVFLVFKVNGIIYGLERQDYYDEYRLFRKEKITGQEIEICKQEFEKNNYQVPTATMTLEQLIKRPEINMNFIDKFIEIPYQDEIKEQVEINLKYEGYIAKAYKEAEKMLKLEKKQIPEDINYDDITNIASEARQKLKEVRPKTIAQAIRISGVNPSDISILSVYLKKEYNKNE